MSKRRSTAQRTLFLRTLPLLLAVSSAFGCGDDASRARPSNVSLDAGPDGLEADADRGDAQDLCPSDCAGAAAAQSNGQAPWECQADALCEAVGFEAPPGFTITTVDTVNTLASARCALEAMRDGRLGSVSWSTSARTSPGVGVSTKLFIRPGRVVLSVESHSADLVSGTTYGHAKLKDRPYFERCVQESEPAALFDCLRNADDAACSSP